MPLHVVFNIVPFIYSHMLLIQFNSMCYRSIVFTVVNFYWPWLTFFFFRSICSPGKPSLTDYQLCLMPCRIVTYAYKYLLMFVSFYIVVLSSTRTVFQCFLVLRCPFSLCTVRILHFLFIYSCTLYMLLHNSIDIVNTFLYS